MYRFVMVQGSSGRRPAVDAAHRSVTDAHADTVAATLSAADAVAARVGTPATDGTAVSTALERELGDRDLFDPLLALLGDAVTAAGREFASTPVPAPPYLAVTSRGPVLRATVEDGRIVVAVEAFAVERDPTRYVRAGEDPATALSVEFRPGRDTET